MRSLWITDPLRVSLLPLRDTISRGAAISPLGQISLSGTQRPGTSASRYVSIVSRLINPFRRRHIFAVVGGMMVVPRDVAIKIRASRAHAIVALIPRGRNGGRFRLPIRFLFAEHPVGRFRQMPGHRADGLRVALAPGDALVQAADVALRRAPARDADRVRGFDERPFQVAVDVRPEPPVTGLPAARVDARRGARIGGQLLGGGG